MLLILGICVSRNSPRGGRFVTKWGNIGSGDGEFQSPGIIAVDGNGFVYVVDYSPDGRVQKFTSDGQFVTKWGGNHCRLYDGGGCEDPDGDGPLELGDGQFYFPSGIAVDMEGFVYVSDYNHRIQKFTPDGQFVTKWGSACDLHNEHGCVDPDGDGPLELGDGQFDYIYDIAIDNNGFVYASEGLNGRIQIFTSDGQFVTKWGSYGHADDELYEPSDIAVGANGFLYLVEYSFNRIKQFTLDGQFVDIWQSYGTGEGEFRHPDDISIDRNGFVYVDDYPRVQKLYHRVQKFTAEGQYLEGLQNQGKLKAIDSNNYFYYIDSAVEDGLIKKVASDGEIIAQWGSLGTGDGELEVVQDIAVDDNGYVYVLDSDTDYFLGIEHHRVQKFTPDGQYVTKWGSYCRLYDGGGCKDPDGDGPLERGDGQFYFPRSIAVDMDGFVYVSDGNDRIQKFTPDGQYVTKWRAYCEDIAIDSKGFLYGTYTDKYLMDAPAEYIPQHILKFTLEGQFVNKWGSFGIDPGQMAGIGDIAVGPDEKIYIADFGNHRVQVFEENSFIRPLECNENADCDDGNFCNGIEICTEGTCQPGTPPCADDGIFCNGIESCNEAENMCAHSGNPCPQDLICDEEWNVCSGCIEDAQCDDSLFCNGFENCVDGDCQGGTSPCPEGVACDEETDACLMPSILVSPHPIMQSRWIPLPLFMSIRGTNTHFSRTSEITFSPPSILPPLSFAFNQQTLFCIGLIMPAWITGSADSIEVSVTTGLEKATGSVEVGLMPFMLNQEEN